MCCASNGRRISCKKRESRKTFELRRQLNSHVGRRCAPDDRRMFRRPLNGRAASVQHCFKPQRSLSALSALKMVLYEITSVQQFSSYLFYRFNKPIFSFRSGECHVYFIFKIVLFSKNECHDSICSFICCRFNIFL